ncbi:MAG TPA: choice-of-anchor D domain-containing protein [Baekduia sp.]|nr:choice-of-anchor D domain-containing protein [Baekduia sp.]
MQARRAGTALVAALLLAFVLAATASGAGITNSGGDLRDGWYPNQPQLAPDAVESGTFGRLWDAAVDGQVYAQPLVVGSRVIVATERNQVYALDGETGAKTWTHDLGPSFPAALIGWGCADLAPDLGVTSTPVIDTATNTIYLTHKTYAPGSTTQAAYYIDALDASTGAQRSGFPKRLTGAAQNAPGIGFDATYEMQRPGLLLLDGVVYAGFGSHCDISPYQGWVFGVDATSGAIKARWSSVTAYDGAGIWQSGSGLMSDGAGRLFVSTGNGGSPSSPLAAPGNGMYGESIVRLDVQADGTLKPGDFFAPSDAAHLDDYDADFASGGVTALRDDAFGTTKFPHVAVAVGKAGYVYLLNRDDLGGIGTGTGRGDRVISRVGPNGGVWSRPGVWPGDGGWIAIPTASPSAGQNPEPGGSSGYLNLYRYRVSAQGVPSLDAPVQSDDAFGFSSSAPVITSDGTTPGSAVLWIVWAPSGSGIGAQLRAYDAIPINGHLRLRRSFPIGQSAKFAMPGIGSGRVYVGTRDGHVYGYGAPVKAEVQAPATTFPVTTVGTTSTASVKLSIAGNVQITSVTASPATFVARTAGTGVPGDYVDGQSVTVPVDFTPSQPGVAGGTLTVATDKGPFTFSLAGTGQAEAAMLTASPPVVSFGGVVVGDQLAGTVTLGNGGGQPLTITRVELPAAPFSVDAAPVAGDVIAAGDAINLGVHFAPSAVGDFNDDLVVETTGGTKTIGLNGSAGLGPALSVAPSGGWSFGTVVVGQSAERTVVVANAGDSPMTITKSKPPTGSAFSVLDGLDEGSVIPPGESRSLRVRFTPAAAGTVTASWVLNAADGTGVHDLALTGEGVMPPVDDGGGTPGYGGGTPDDGGGTTSAAGGDVPPPPTLVPLTPVAPDLAAQGPVLPAKVLSRLSVSKLRPSRDGRRLGISGRVVSAATGPISVTLSARVGRRTVTAVTGARLWGRSTYAITLVIPRAARSWRRLQVSVRFAGSSRVRPGTASMVLIRAR